MRKVFNVLGCIIAFFLSILLICNLMVLPILQGVTGLLQHKALEDVIEQIDLAEVVTSTPELMDELEASGIDAEVIRALLSCDAADELLQSIAGDALRALRGELAQPSLTLPVLTELVNEYRAELIPIVMQMAPAEVPVNEEMAGLMLDQILAEYGEDLVSALNESLVELQQSMQQDGITDGFLLLTNGIITAVLIGVSVVLAGLIFLCRLRHAQGLVWIGVDAILAALPTFGAGKLMTGAFLLSQLPTGAVGAAILPLLRKVATSVFIGSAILLVLGILCIVGFVLLRKRRMKKAAAVTQTALPTEESSSL